MAWASEKAGLIRSNNIIRKWISVLASWPGSLQMVPKWLLEAPNWCPYSSRPPPPPPVFPAQITFSPGDKPWFPGRLSLIRQDSSYGHCRGREQGAIIFSLSPPKSLAVERKQFIHDDRVTDDHLLEGWWTSAFSNLWVCIHIVWECMCSKV